ncbi:MAG: hypothetical protein COX92_02450 [Candidatus Nealsonbacteria bacterium CG_4_10_14_0_2_um_filter_40_15]|uniref:DUF5678 domain-containing protein n=2 Tax=Candidatus Nealsoniibacteriota TaxID=1817911 RepID=A0A2M7D8K5_9BACT|nr:MAG: hypothetical protein COS26_00385 [Candidatus Nealsonbacteria bacterium CG02_land_8_20_14_3_00_40_11]PIZ86854.1 MAG: hypothetical protein COX92_02450 [Candidatus Nealsonbacteria bacterium CG_4_10_14_0_2_um_filter_40_15]
MSTKQKNYDLRELLKPYANKWVALSGDHKEVIAEGNKLKDVASKARTKDVVFLKVFPSESFYMPGIYEI